MCDKKNSVLFTDTECVVLSLDFKLTDESHVLLKVPRKDNMYSVDLKNVVPQGGLTCLFAKATPDESNLWHRRLGHVNFKTINKLVKGNLVRGLPSKLFEINQTCVACQKGKQHRASCKTKTVSSISQPLQMLHMDLFGPTFVKSLMKKMYCLVVTDDFSRFSWVFFLATKDNKRTEANAVKASGNPQQDLKDKGVINSGCSRHMIQNRSYLTDYEEIDGGFVAFRGNAKGGKITGKDFKLTDESHVLLKVPRKDNMYSVDLKNVVPQGGLTCLFEKATPDESDLWHRRLGHVNFKTMNKLVKGNLVRGTKENIDAGKASVETIPGKDYILLPLWTQDSSLSSSLKDSSDAGFKPSGEEEKKDIKDPGNEDKDNVVGKNIVYGYNDDPNMPNLEEIVHSDDDEDVGAETDITNLDTYIPVSPIPTTRIHKDHSVKQIIRDIHSAPQTRRMTKSVTEHGPKKVIQALKDPSWIEAMQEELLQFKLQQVWTLVDLPHGYTQEKGIDYDEVFAPVVRIEAIRLFLAYASFKDFFVYQMDVKSAFMYGKIKEEVYVCQPLGFEDPEFLDRVYKVERALYGLHQAPRAWYKTLSTYLLDNGFERGPIDKTLFIKRVKYDILLVQVYFNDIIFGSTRKEMCTEFEKMMHKKFQMSSMGELTFFLGLQTTSTPMETHKTLLKDEKGEDVDEHLYLKGQPKLGLWYPKDSPFDLVAYTNSDYAGASLDRKSTTGEAEYVVASSCCGLVLFIQNQLLDYGYNFMQTKFHIDNESTICIVKNPVFHSKTKHIEIRHHFIKDSNKKKLIQMIKIHTNQNVADLLTKAFDVSRFQYLIASIRMLNL
ncbi:putative ribonuclease H-like domain-containing protein [Tanacetum coccineum]